MTQPVFGILLESAGGAGLLPLCVLLVLAAAAAALAVRMVRHWH